MGCKSVVRTTPQNRLYHSLLRDFHKQALKLHLTVENMEFLKRGLKQLDEDYPKEGDKPLSSSKIDTKQLTQHVEFIIAYMGEYGLTPVMVEEEFNRIIRSYRAYN